MDDAYSRLAEIGVRQQVRDICLDNVSAEFRDNDIAPAKCQTPKYLSCRKKRPFLIGISRSQSGMWKVQTIVGARILQRQDVSQTASACQLRPSDAESAPLQSLNKPGACRRF